MTRRNGRTNLSAAVAAAIRHQTVLVATTVLLSANAASAGSLFVNFCPDDRKCPNSIADASMLFTEAVATADPNDFNVTLRIEGNAVAPRNLRAEHGEDRGEPINELSFKAPGLRWTGYDVGNTWSTALPGQPREWNFYVNFPDGRPLHSFNVLNVRARLMSDHGRHLGKLSVKGAASSTEQVVNVPEPGTWMLLGLACLGLTAISRRAICR